MLLSSTKNRGRVGLMIKLSAVFVLNLMGENNANSSGKLRRDWPKSDTCFLTAIEQHKELTVK